MPKYDLVSVNGFIHVWGNVCSLVYGNKKDYPSGKSRPLCMNGESCVVSSPDTASE